MNAIVVNYVQLICFTLFMRNNVDCQQLMSQIEEVQTFKVSTCTAECLQNVTTTQPEMGGGKVTNKLGMCYDSCSSNSEKVKKIPEVKIHEFPSNFSFHLFCRDASRLAVEFDLDHYEVPEDETFIYLIKIRETDASFEDYKIYLSDRPLVEMTNLTSQTSYELSSMIISSANIAYKLDAQTFTTLKRDFVPENITNISIDQYHPVNETHVDVVFKWEPARDETCFYEILIHYEDADLIPRRRQFPDIFYYVQRLPYNEKVSVAVRGLNSLHRTRESHLHWIELYTDECKMANDPSNCAPEKPENLRYEIKHVIDNVYDFSLKWNEPSYHPDFYKLTIRDINPKKDNETPIFHVERLDGASTSHSIANLTLNGHTCLVQLEPHIGNLSNYADLYPRIDDLIVRKRFNFTYLIVGLGSLSFLAICMSLVTYSRMLKKQRGAGENNSMDLDLIKDLEFKNRAILATLEELTRDDRMEIDRDNIEILEDLGEGAFGYVKRGMAIKDEKKMEVAVKMLKNSSNFEDIKQFHQEISVMKSVGPHANIVSIVGHCTSNIEELMLLTEFCDSGNLLELLRREFASQLRFYDGKTSTSSSSSSSTAIVVVEEDEGIFSCQSKPLFVSNQLYDELNNNIVQPATATATNTMYFELAGDQVTIEMPPQTEAQLLTSADLVSFAKQVSDGMSFLARKKVVHRDLAARNVLVSSTSSRHVKIADFGLSREFIQEKNYYRKSGSGKLPIKWLALESLSHQIYTSASDVWSFGVLLYEIISLGATPYPSVRPDQLLKHLSAGLRMDRPSHCHTSLYEVMQACWHGAPQARPTFDELSAQLQSFLQLEKCGDITLVDLSRLFDRCGGGSDSGNGSSLSETSA